MIQIMTDSASDFEPWEYERMNVKCIPLCVMFGNTQYEENVDITKDEFYRLLAESKDFPRTSQPSPYTIECHLKDAFENGDETIIITLSSKLSGFYQNLNMVKAMMDYDKCYVFDGRNDTGGNRLLVEYAVKLRGEGKSASEIIAALEEVRSKIVLYACVDTLEYLHRGGRISGTSYTVGSIAHIKPIIRFNAEGALEVPAKTMGMRKGVDLLCKKVLENVPDKEYPVYIMYTADKSNGILLAKKLAEYGHPVPDEHFVHVGAAIGSHIGPNVCGMVYVRK